MRSLKMNNVSEKNFFQKHYVFTAFLFVFDREFREIIYSAYRFVYLSNTDENEQKDSQLQFKLNCALVKMTSDILSYLSTIALVVLVVLAHLASTSVPMLPVIALLTILVASVAADLYCRWVRPNDNASPPKNLP